MVKHAAAACGILDIIPPVGGAVSALHLPVKLPHPNVITPLKVGPCERSSSPGVIITLSHPSVITPPLLSHPVKVGSCERSHHTGDAITPRYYHTRHVYHTPCRWGPANAFCHTGDTNYHIPYTIPHPSDNFVKSENVITRLYYLV